MGITEEQLNNKLESKITAPDVGGVKQALVVEEIDEKGKPTKWSVTDLKDGTLELVNEIVLEEDVTGIVFTTDAEGNPLEEKHILIQAKIQSSTGVKHVGACYVNDRWIAGSYEKIDVPTGWFDYIAYDVNIVSPALTKSVCWIMNYRRAYNPQAGVGIHDRIRQVNFEGDFLAGSTFRIFRYK